MKILGIETSCDETGAAVIEGTVKSRLVKLVSNSLATSLANHAATGGIIPENAAREQIKFIIPVIKESLQQAGMNIKHPAIDAIAVTYGPGLIGSLLVGVETAKTLSYLWKIPIIPVNHLYGHIYANWLMVNGKWKMEKIRFPAIALVVSGGHTDLVYMKSHGDLTVIGGTRDDAAGEAFDKIGRLLGLRYPAGPVISKLAEKGDPKAFLLPRPMWDSKDYDFSFSGLKTSVLNLIKKNGWDFGKTRTVILSQALGSEESLQRNLEKSFDSPQDENLQLIADLCASVQKAIVDVLVFKTLSAVKEYKVKSLILGGGVAANKSLTDNLKFEIGNLKFEIDLRIPIPSLCTDNAAMIATAGFYNDNFVNWKEIAADPELYY